MTIKERLHLGCVNCTSDLDNSIFNFFYLNFNVPFLNFFILCLVRVSVKIGKIVTVNIYYSLILLLQTAIRCVMSHYRNLKCFSMSSIFKILIWFHTLSKPCIICIKLTSIVYISI